MIPQKVFFIVHISVNRTIMIQYFTIESREPSRILCFLSHYTVTEFLCYIHFYNIYLISNTQFNI